MLNSRIRKAAAAASPVNASGVAAISVWVSAPRDVNAAWKICRNDGTASWPVACRTIPERTIANTIAPSGPATSSQRGGCSLRSTPLRVVPSGHQQADLLDVRARGGELAEHAALVHDRDPVCEREDLVEILADQEHRDALGSCLAQVRVHGLDRADVEAARRSGGDEHARPAGELPREH